MHMHGLHENQPPIDVCSGPANDVRGVFFHFSGSECGNCIALARICKGGAIRLSSLVWNPKETDFSWWVTLSENYVKGMICR